MDKIKSYDASFFKIIKYLSIYVLKPEKIKIKYLIFIFCREKMYFYWDYVIDGFLFENFNIDSLTKCLLVIFGVFFLAFSSQGLKILQKTIEEKLTNWNKVPPRSKFASFNKKIFLKIY